MISASTRARLLFYSSVRKQNVSEDMPWSAQHSGVDLSPSLNLGMLVDHGYWSSPQEKMDKMSLPRGVCGFWRAVECHGKPQLPLPAKPPPGWDPSHGQPLVCSQGLYCQQSGANHQQCALIPAFLMGKKQWKTERSFSILMIKRVLPIIHSLHTRCYNFQFSCTDHSVHLAG